VWGSPGDGCQFRVTLPRRQGEELAGSPIPLEPLDSARRRAEVRVGQPYRRVGAGGVDA